MSSIKYNTSHVLLEKVAANWINAVRDTLEDEGGNPADLLLDTGLWSYALEQWAREQDGGIDGAKLDLAHGLMFGYDVVDDNGRLEQKYVVSAPLPNREYLRLYLSADGTVMPLTTQAGEKYAPIVGGDHVLTHDEVAQLSNANMIARAFVITPVYLDVLSGKFHDDGAAAPILTVDTTDNEAEPEPDDEPLAMATKRSHDNGDGTTLYVFTRNAELQRRGDWFTYLNEYLTPDGYPVELYTEKNQCYAPNIDCREIYTRSEAIELAPKARVNGYTVHAIYATKGPWKDV